MNRTLRSPISRPPRAECQYSPLQRRLQVMERSPDRAWLNLIENVPAWTAPPEVSAALREDIHSYAPANGVARLIDRVVARERERHGVAARAEEVLITNGGLHALSLVFGAAPRRGIALCQSPVLGAIPAMLGDAGFEVHLVSTRGGLDELEAALHAHGAAVSLVFVNSPNNPTGQILGADAIARLVTLARAREFDLVVDMVYDAYWFGAKDAATPLQATDDWSRVYVVNSMSKNYGAPGLRVGWIVTAEANVQRLGVVLEREVIAVSGPSQDLACRLLDHGNHALAASVRDGYARVAEALRAIPGLVYEMPEGGTQFFVELPVADAEAFCDFALVEAALGLVSGANYRGVTRPHVRIPIGAPAAVLVPALAALDQALAAFGAVAATAWAQ
jgi:beta-methylarginine biosynthesis bifunctional aminotransferase